MLKKVRDGLLFIIAIAPDAVGAFTTFVIIELIFQMYVSLGYGNPDLKYLFVQFGMGLFVFLAMFRLVVYCVKKRS